MRTHTVNAVNTVLTWLHSRLPHGDVGDDRGMELVQGLALAGFGAVAAGVIIGVVQSLGVDLTNAIFDHISP